MQIVDNKALIIRTRNPHKYQVIPKHKVMEVRSGVYDVAVYWGLDETRVLRNLGVKNAPSPITRRYDWPGKYKPFAHQRVSAEFLTMHKRAFNLSEMGVGKTASTLWAADYLMETGRVRKALILSPLSTVERVWKNDIFDVLMHRTAAVVHGTREQREKALKALS